MKNIESFVRNGLIVMLISLFGIFVTDETVGDGIVLGTLIVVLIGSLVSILARMVFDSARGKGDDIPKPFKLLLCFTTGFMASIALFSALSWTHIVPDYSIIRERYFDVWRTSMWVATAILGSLPWALGKVFRAKEPSVA